MQPVAWSAVEKFVQQAIWLLLFFILAPILGPRPYGQFAIVMAFIGFCELVLTGPVVHALLSMEPLERDHLRTASLAGLALALLAGGAVFLSAPYIAQAFGDTEIEPIFKTLSAVPAIMALTAAPVAVLKAHLLFRLLALRTILGLAIGGIAGVGLALSGAGVWSLVGQFLVQRIAEAIILWSTAHTRFELGWSKRHFAELRHYMVNVFFIQAMAFASGHIPRLILGFFLGPVDLGLFVFAWRILDALVWTTLHPPTEVARITLRQFQNRTKELEAAFGRILEDTALVAFPVCCGAAAVIPLIFTILLDSRWQPAVFASQLMILSAIPLVVFFIGASVLLAMKRPQDEAKMTLAHAVAGSLFVLLAAPFGLNAACFVTLLRQLLLIPMLLYFLSAQCGISPRAVAAAVSPALVASLLVGYSVTLAAPIVEHQFGPIASLVILVCMGIAIYVPLAGIVAPRGATRLVSSARRLMLRERTAPPPPLKSPPLK
jgi:O-antigen/teichoic acid export membrane protein